MPNFTIPAPPPLANASQAGLVGTITQTFAGQKTFQNLVITSAGVRFADGTTQNSAYPFAEKVLSQGEAAPVAGTWSVGDIVFNGDPSVGEPVGWVCVSAGTPGTWQPFGEITQTVTHGIAAPVAGTWLQGDIVYNSLASAGGNLGWVCVSAGTPGTWKEFGLISL